MGIKVEDLWAVCERCEGKGEYTENTGGAGGGLSVRTVRTGPREQCGGTGGRPTEDGKAILEFLRRAHLYR